MTQPMNRHPFAPYTLVLCVFLCVGCGKKGLDADIKAFKDAGRDVSEFSSTDPAPMQAKKCKQGTVDQLTVLLCEYASREAAENGLRNAATWAGESPTWLSLKRDKIVFVAADRTESDPHGKNLTALTKVFRRMVKK